MSSKIPKYKLKGLRLDKVFSQNAQGLNNRKKYRAERREAAKRAWQKKLLMGASPERTPLIYSSSSDEENTYDGELIKFGESTNKIRRLIAKYFLSKSVRELENMELQTVNSLLLFGLMSFMSALYKCLPRDQFPDLGQKFARMGANTFTNRAMRRVLHPLQSAHQE